MICKKQNIRKLVRGQIISDKHSVISDKHIEVSLAKEVRQIKKV